jgi:phosphoglycolate phosphatase
VKPSLVILDLDGTLYSSTATTLGAVERAVHDFNEKRGASVGVPTQERILGAVGSTREQYTAKVFPELPEADRGEMNDLIWHWERELVDGGKGCLYPGAVDMLEVASGEGCLLAVATNAGTGYMNHILDYFGIRKYFADARCAGAEGTTDKGELISRILENLGVDPLHAVMAGDRITDMQGARSSGVWAVGCTWGFGSKGELFAAHRFVDSFPELTELLRTWP